MDSVLAKLSNNSVSTVQLLLALEELGVSCITTHDYNLPLRSLFGAREECDRIEDLGFNAYHLLIPLILCFGHPLIN